MKRSMAVPIRRLCKIVESKSTEVIYTNFSSISRMVGSLSGVVSSAKKKGIDLDKKKKICISLDVNGPLTSTDSAALEPYPGIREAIRELDKLGVYIIINSAWDICTTRIFDQKKLGCVADGIIGENGSVYAFPDTEPIFTTGTDTRELLLDLFIKALKSCTSAGYSFADQGNLVNACFYHEFESGLIKNICRQGVKRPSTQEFFETLKRYGLEAKLYDDRIEMDDSRENYRRLQTVLGHDYKLVTIRSNISNNGISIQLDGYKDKSICLSYLDVLAKRVVHGLNGWENYKVNDDFCIDYFLSKNVLKKDISKASALEALLKDLCKRLGIEREDFLILGIGDGDNDTCVGNMNDSLFFGITGTRSESDCDMKVASGMEFLHLAKNISQHWIKNNQRDHETN